MTLVTRGSFLVLYFCFSCESVLPKHSLSGDGTLSANSVSITGIPYSASSVVIDGNLNGSEWAKARALSLDAFNRLYPSIVVEGSLANLSDLSGTAYLQHNGSHLFLGIRVNDSMRIETSPDGSNWKMDSVEFFLDSDNSSSINSWPESLTGFHGLTSVTGGTAGSFRDQGVWSSATKIVSGGYGVEFSISLARTNLQPGRPFGLDFSVIDYDRVRERADTVIFYSSHSRAIYDESKWGKFQLAPSTESPPPPPPPPPSSVIQPIVKASRLTGSAPLAVLFDATETRGLTDNDFVNSLIEWEFDDPLSGEWSYSQKSRNKATGFLAAHIFENPGNYAVKIRITDRNRIQSHIHTVTISVSSPPPETYCFATSSSRDFTDCPTTNRTFHIVTDDISATILQYAKPNRRLFFRRGDTWSGTTRSDLWGKYFMRIKVAGPLLIDAFGTATRPLPRFQHLSVDDSITLDLRESTDVRVRNLNFWRFSNGSSYDQQGTMVALRFARDALVSDLKFEGSMKWVIGDIDGTNIFIVDNQFLGNDHYSLIGPAQTTALLGSRFSHARFLNGSTNLPVGKTLVQHNSCSNPSSYCVRTYTGSLIASDNRFHSSNAIVANAQCSVCGPESRINVIERNLFTFPSGVPYTGPAIQLGSKDVGVIRNNRFENIQGGGIVIDYDQSQPPVVGNSGVRSEKLAIFHNSYSGTSDFLQARRAATLLEIKNNGIVPMTLNFAGFGTVDRIDSGATVPVMDDFYGNSRPAVRPRDGAVE